MPQSRLPDINTAFITHRRDVISSLKARNYGACFGSIQALQGLLPEGYRIVISTIEYNKLTKHEKFYTCNFCGEESERSKIRIDDVLLTVIDSVLLGRKTQKMWTCPKCKEDNGLEDTEISETTLKEPYFLKVVPNPPERKDGLHDRSTYHNKMEQWVRTTLAELEAQMAQFRDDNWTKEEEISELEIDTSIEEQS